MKTETNYLEGLAVIIFIIVLGVMAFVYYLHTKSPDPVPASPAPTQNQEWPVDQDVKG